jgi:hypothetical protein
MVFCGELLSCDIGIAPILKRDGVSLRHLANKFSLYINGFNSNLVGRGVILSISIISLLA